MRHPLTGGGMTVALTGHAAAVPDAAAAAQLLQRHVDRPHHRRFLHPEETAERHYQHACERSVSGTST